MSHVTVIIKRSKENKTQYGLKEQMFVKKIQETKTPANLIFCRLEHILGRNVSSFRHKTKRT